MAQNYWEYASRAIEEATGEPFIPEIWYGIDMDRSVRDITVLKQGTRRYFLKADKPKRVTDFECEAEGLRALDATGLIRVPKVIACGKTRGRAYLILEALHLNLPSELCQRRLGEQIAAVHRLSAPEHGWGRDNFIGKMPQINTRHACWTDFFRECRLRPQLEWAHANGLPSDHSVRMIDAVDRILEGHNPRPSLLHGDLWFHNAGCLPGDVPVVFDPSVYYGDREIEIALSMMFMGLGKPFYEAYFSSWPVDDGFRHRIKLYQLYHVLNHFNLYGGNDADVALELMRTLIR